MCDDAAELIGLLGKEIEPGEADLIEAYFAERIPPITSRAALAVMYGYSEGFVWSLLERPQRYYRRFEIPKGKKVRIIYAPQVALKLIQKWLSIHFQKKWIVSDSVYGFIPGRSHLGAAACHIGSRWVVSLDIENFFPSVSIDRVRMSLEKLGYKDKYSKKAIERLTCIGGGLAQGSPASPVISNIALSDMDEEIQSLSRERGWTYTRYADDIVLSGKEGDPQSVATEAQNIIERHGWKVAGGKSYVDALPNRLKVHGLLVHGEKIRLTKGYRNRIRAYKHLLADGRVRKADLAKMRGHISFATSVYSFNQGK